MVRKKVFALAAFVASLLVAPASAQKVLLLPGGGSSVSVIANNTFTPGTPISASPSPFAVLANPMATRYFVVSSADVTVADGTGSTVQTIGVGLPIAAAAITPDGQKFLVAAGTESDGTLYIFDTSSGTMNQVGAVTIGARPSGLTASTDSGSAYVLTDSGLRRVDLTDNTVTATLVLSGASAPNSKVVVGPNGLIYVNAEGVVYEVVPRTLTLRKSISTPNAFARKPVFSPDGKTMFLANPRANNSNQPALMTVDLETYSIANKVNYYGVKFDYLVWASADTLYAYSGSHHGVFEVAKTLEGLGDTATFPSVGQISNVSAVFASSESPTDSNPGPRYLYVLTPATLYRVDLDPPSGATPGQVTKSVAIPAGTSGGVYIAPAAQPGGTVGGVLKYGDGQTVTGGAYSLPLMIRVLDSAGKPIAGVPIDFVPSAGTVDAMPLTNGEGFAQAILKAPSVGGAVTVTATLGTGESAVFTLNGTGGGGTIPGPGPGGSGIQILSGQGQVTQGQKYAIEPLSLVLRDSNGAPVEGASVTFSLANQTGDGFIVAPACGAAGPSLACKTDENGFVSVRYLAPSVNSLFQSWKQIAVTATVSDAAGVPAQKVTFIETAVPEKLGTYDGPVQFQKLLTPTVTGSIITAQAGTTAPDAIQMLITAQSGPSASRAIPNVGVQLRATQNYDATTPSPAYCVGGTALSDEEGMVSCNLAVYPTTKPGIYPIFAVVGGNTPLNFNLEVTAAPPPAPVATTATIVSGNGQSGTIGQTLSPLVAVVKDQFGAVMPNATVQWTVTPTGAATLTSPATKTGTDGRASAGVVLGSTLGAVTVRMTAGNASATFNLTVTVTIGNLAKLSGDGQSVVIGQQFQPVSVKVTDTQGNAVAGVAVTFNATGSATPASDTAVTNASGVAEAAFTATNNPGQVAITALAGGKSVTFNLAARLPGPVLTADSFLNAASMQPGISFGSIVAIKGDGLTTGLAIPPGACLTEASDGNLQRELPTRLAGIEVRFEYVHLAPILAICKTSDGSDQINVQAPFELAPAGINISVTTGAGTAAETMVSVGGVEITNALPGIFEYDVSSTARAAVALRPDGTVVSPTNQARRGEVIRVFTTGLGPVLPVGDVPVKTNQPGYPGQKPFFTTSVQLGGSGAPGVTAEYAQNLIGVFIVTFQVPADAQTGAAVPLIVSVLKDNGQTVSSKGSSIPIAQ